MDKQNTQTLGESIYHMISEVPPAEARQALKEAEERMHDSFERKQHELIKDMECLKANWDKFKGEPTPAPSY